MSNHPAPLLHQISQIDEVLYRQKNEGCNINDTFIEAPNTYIRFIYNVVTHRLDTDPFLKKISHILPRESLGEILC